jgi:hypothetical protein
MSERLPPEHAAEIRALSQYPSLARLKWGPCRVCGTFCPTNWGPEGDRHITCEDPVVEPVKAKREAALPVRRKKEPDANQGGLF